MMMNRCAIIQQNNGYAAFREDVARDFVVCPKPRRLKATTDFLDVLLSKSGCRHDSEQVYSCLPGSPPSRVSNPLIQNARFVEVKWETCLTPSFMERQHTTFPTLNSSGSTSSSSRKGRLVRSNFGNKPTVRVEGFEAPDRDGRNCGISVA